LNSRFPALHIVVSKKADSLYPVVSAASIAAKVTRDRRLEQWQFREERNGFQLKIDDCKWGSGYPGGVIKVFFLNMKFKDPTTKRFLETSLDRVFGYPSLVRFDWQTTKTILADSKKCAQVTW
jgi:ribonuclease H2 subunit A